MKTGLLWLEGPLQAWGVDSRFGRRDTLPFPTRSGVLGMLCAALGKGGPQKEWLEKMRPYKQDVIAYARFDKRCPFPQPGLLRDFHMVGSGYDDSDKWQNMLVPKKADGAKPSNNPGARITYRYYIQDMAFAVLLAMPDDEAQTIGQGMERPVWPVYLGRRCCVPSDIIWRGEHATFADAAKAAEQIAREKSRRAVFRVVEDAKEDGETMLLADVPLNFGLYKNYMDRIVTVVAASAS